ncbi:Nuclear pore complex protein [Cardamine amara subsp. amara]|uniref:Nuclear pore complex protein n=1 Tax=Cardamine amara subsp. amara TaxID=228776 RepID=A0ABD1BWN4_CARAN
MSHEESISLAHVGKAWKLVDYYCQEAAQPWKHKEEGLQYTLRPQTIRAIKPWIEVGKLWALLPMITEKFKTSKRMIHGSFPEIRRAWAIFDDSLFLWSFDASDGNVWRYSDEGKPVIDVGLVKPQPGFVEDDVEFLLVWVTPLELFVSKVFISEDGAQRLERMIVYKSSIDGVRMSCLLCTSKGRIFVAGQNSHIYELIYTSGAPCRLLCCTPIAASSFFNRFMFGADDHVVEMVVDNQRKTLYTRTKKGKLEAYFLGMNGDSCIEKVGEVWNLYFAPSVVCISPLSKLESKWSHAHLVAVLSNGSRMYFSTSSSEPETPDCLRKVTETPPILPNMEDAQDTLNIKVEPAFSSLGTLFLSYPSPDKTFSFLLLVDKDSSCTKVGTLRELTFSFRFDGRVLFAAEVLPTPDATSTMLSLYSQVLGESYENTCGILRGRGDLLTQHLLPKKEILLFTTTCMVELSFNRPVDFLITILSGRMFSSYYLNAFVSYWGEDETAAMYLMLASRIILGAGELDSLIPTRAADLFEGMKTEKMPQLDASMAQAKLIHSAAHKGLYLCTSRLLYPLWNSCVLSKRSSSDSMPEDGVVSCRFSTEAMNELQSKLRSLGEYLSDAEDSSGGELANVRQGLPDVWNEDVRSMEFCRHLIIRSAEALFLLQILSRHDIAICTWGCEESLRRTLLQFEFRQLVHSEEGDQIAKVLVSAIMEKEPLGSTTRETLLLFCPSYSKEALVGLPSHSEEALVDSPSHSDKAFSSRRKWTTLLRLPSFYSLRKRGNTVKV